MDLRAKNEQFLKKHLQQKYSREDLFEDMYNEAWVFFGEKIDEEDLGAATHSLVELDKHLEKYGKDTYGTALLGRVNAVPLDSVIRNIGEGRQSPEPGVPVETWEAEATSYERSKEELRPLLPPFEYEALEMLTQSEHEQQPVLTIGFTPNGLQMLLRRALIRKMWSKEVESSPDQKSSDY
jgi:ribosomal protein S15P/S13E